MCFLFSLNFLFGPVMAQPLLLAWHLLNQCSGWDNLINHYSYVMLQDECLMGGISHKAVTLAGHLKLNELIALSIDDSTSLSCSDDIKEHFSACG
jgi:transketolase